MQYRQYPYEFEYRYVRLVYNMFLATINDSF